MPALPSGTVTFLFTDIEGSTRLWELHPAEMTTALAAHDALMRRVIERNDGCVFATAGDGFHAGFHTATSALTAAYEAQLGLATNPAPGPVNLKVRMALHTGAAEVRDNEFFSVRRSIAWHDCSVRGTAVRCFSHALRTNWCAMPYPWDRACWTWASTG